MKGLGSKLNLLRSCLISEIFFSIGVGRRKSVADNKKGVSDLKASKSKIQAKIGGDKVDEVENNIEQLPLELDVRFKVCEIASLADLKKCFDSNY